MQQIGQRDIVPHTALLIACLPVAGILRFFYTPLARFPLAHSALQVAATKFAAGELVGDLFNKLMFQPPGCVAKFFGE